MKSILITGVGGLVGSTVAVTARQRGYRVTGIDSDSRGRWFGAEGSVAWKLEELEHAGIEIIRGAFQDNVHHAMGVDLVVHCASQPSHDYSCEYPWLDSETNYMGTLQLLEVIRRKSPNTLFAFISTNKVYGDWVNRLEYRQSKHRLVLNSSMNCADPFWGVSEQCPLDGSLHTPFGVSKLAADLMVQEYSRCFGMMTVAFRCGCLTGPSGSAVEKQGFLGYLVKCAVEGRPYTVYGHDGYQVRDNLAAIDLADAIFQWAEQPVSGAFNMGGGPENAVSVREVLRALCQNHMFPIKSGPARLGDHKWWISDTRLFQTHYPNWRAKTNIWDVINEMVECARSSREAQATSEPISPGSNDEAGVQ